MAQTMAAVVPAPQVMKASGKFGSSARIVTNSFAPLAELEFWDFAPAPCSCCACLVPEVARARMYARIFDNRLEANMPIAPFMCCTASEECVLDHPMTSFMDRPPHRVGMCCFCIPCTFCGPPVVFVEKPKCCCIDLEPYYGSMIKAAPANCFGLKIYLCCGKPCYTRCSSPIFTGTKNSDRFLKAWRQALRDYAARPELKGKIDLGEMAIMETVQDGVLDLQSADRIDVKSPGGQ